MKIKKGDILFVNNPTIQSPKFIDFIKDKVGYIIHNKRLPQNLQESNLVFIQNKDRVIMEMEDYAMINITRVLGKKEEKEAFQKIIMNYQKKRK